MDMFSTRKHATVFLCKKQAYVLRTDVVVVTLNYTPYYYIEGQTYTSLVLGPPATATLNH